MNKLTRALNTVVLLYASMLAAQVSAAEFSITLKSNTDEQVNIGDLQTTALGDGLNSYKINWRAEIFEEHFLSMRPFKCVPGGAKLWCHTPYPYEINRQFSEEDLTDLEYDLIFVWKPEGEYGVNLWNGVYYDLTPTEFGWAGTMQEYDLNILGIPPDAGELRPIKQKDLYEANIEDHLFPFIEIRKKD